MANSGTLHRYFLRNGGKPIHKWFHYFDIYERHFERHRDRPISILEIGVQGGGSLNMWRDYFHPESKIVGIDIDPSCKDHEKGNIFVHIGSQDDQLFLQSVARQYGQFDIIIDDGSHINSHIISTFEELYGYVSPHGTYLIEDVHTSYWSKYGGGLYHEGSFIEFAKKKIDEINAVHVEGDFSPTQITKTTDSIVFYDSVVVFERCPQGRRQQVSTRRL